MPVFRDPKSTISNRNNSFTSPVAVGTADIVACAKSFDDDAPSGSFLFVPNDI